LKISSNLKKEATGFLPLVSTYQSKSHNISGNRKINGRIGKDTIIYLTKSNLSNDDYYLLGYKAV
jgi:hypothetical protein